MKVLVTGKNGQVGRPLVNQLTGTHELLAVGRDQLDITDEQAVLKLVTTFAPDIIINAAAYTAVDRAEEEVELAYFVNRDGVLFLARAAEQVGAALLHISTDYVFAGDRDGAYCETDITVPKNVYGESKLAGEQAVIETCSRYIILRTAWVFGEFGNNFVKTMICLGRDREQLGVVNDQYGGPTYSGDIAAVLIKVAEKIYVGNDVLWGVYHYSGMPNVNWYEFAQYIFEQAVVQGLLEKAPPLKAITTADYPTLAKRPSNSCLFMDKIEKEFGIQACDWRSALKDIYPYGH